LFPLLACISVVAVEARQAAQRAGILNRLEFATAPGTAAAFVPLGGRQ
jgi:hypothetical protein